MLRDPSLIPLSHQHQHGLALSVLIERGLKADPSREKASELCRKVADMFELELVQHFEVEEKVLFPAVRSALASDEIVDQLVAQHREIEALAGRLAAATQGDRIPLLKEFGELLSRHIRIEERQLFEEIQEKLLEQDLAALGKQIDERLRKICPTSLAGRSELL